MRIRPVDPASVGPRTALVWATFSFLFLSAAEIFCIYELAVIAWTAIARPEIPLNGMRTFYLALGILFDSTLLISCVQTLLRLKRMRKAKTSN
jgi:hypothetical protein